MNTKAGIWIDHQQAYLVLIDADTDVITHKHIESDMEKRVRFSSHTADIEDLADDQRDHRYAGHLQVYYDKVIAQLDANAAVLVFGPGEAKRELEQRIISHGHSQRIVGVETTDKMTEAQIAAKVRHHYHIVTNSV